ncbi:SnoaL-like domain-containing protein [Sphingobium faniae]|nr:SnoaL-like domain-containing protein [Sphingobium faniae]
MKTLEDLIAIEQIRLVKARYLRAIDLKDMDLLRSVVADDVEVDGRGATTDPRTGMNLTPGVTGEVICGADKLIAAVGAGLPHMTTIHHVTSGEITVDDEDHASGIWPMFDRLIFSQGPVSVMSGYGHYFETYERINGVWKIKSLKLTRISVESE